MNSVFKKRKPVPEEAEKQIALSTAWPPPPPGHGRASGLTVQGQPVIPYTSCHVLAHHHLHVLQGLRGQGVPKAGFLPPRESRHQPASRLSDCSVSLRAPEAVPSRDRQHQQTEGTAPGKR